MANKISHAVSLYPAPVLFAFLAFFSFYQIYLSISCSDNFLSNSVGVVATRLGASKGVSGQIHHQEVFEFSASSQRIYFKYIMRQNSPMPVRWCGGQLQLANLRKCRFESHIPRFLEFYRHSSIMIVFKYNTLLILHPTQLVCWRQVVCSNVGVRVQLPHPTIFTFSTLSFFLCFTKMG